VPALGHRSTTSACSDHGSADGAGGHDRGARRDRENTRWLRVPADIVDCRSYRGFSGSAVFGTLAYAELRPTPNPPAAALAQGHDEPPPLGRISHAASFAGVFTAHLSDEDDDRDIPASRYGMGIMVPCDYVREALMTETLKDQRERAAREMADREAQEGAPIEEALMASEFDRFEDLAKQLVNTPKPQS